MADSSKTYYVNLYSAGDQYGPSAGAVQENRAVAEYAASKGLGYIGTFKLVPVTEDDNATNKR